MSANSKRVFREVLRIRWHLNRGLLSPLGIYGNHIPGWRTWKAKNLRQAPILSMGSSMWLALSTMTLLCPHVCAAGHKCWSQVIILKAIVCFQQLFRSFSLARKKVSSDRGLPFNWVPEWIRKYTKRHLAGSPGLLTEKTWEMELWTIEILGGIVISVRLTNTVLFNFTHQIFKIIYWKGLE